MAKLVVLRQVYCLPLWWFKDGHHVIGEAIGDDELAVLILWPLGVLCVCVCVGGWVGVGVCVCGCVSMSKY